MNQEDCDSAPCLLCQWNGTTMGNVGKTYVKCQKNKEIRFIKFLGKQGWTVQQKYYDRWVNKFPWKDPQ